MILYASATLTGCELLTSDGKHRTRLWRTVEKDSVKSVKSDWLTIALIVIFNCEGWIAARAGVELAMEGGKQSTYRLALRIQKIERAMTRVTKERDTNDIDREVEYDGNTVTREDLEYEGYSNDSETRQCNFTQLQGKRGFVGVRRVRPSIPCLALCKIDEGFMRVRNMMLAGDKWLAKYPPRKLVTR